MTRRPAADMAWVRQLLDWQKETEDPGEFLESLRFEINSAEVYVFTPRGDVIALPTGSTPVDFAYAIHTEVGHRTIGARVNGRLVPLESTLDNGDVVEVFTSKAPNAGPSRDWLALRQVPARPQQDPPVVHQGAPRGGHRAGQGADRPADAQGGPAAQAGAHPRDAEHRGRRDAARRRVRALRRGRRGQPRRADRRTPGHRPVRRRGGRRRGPRRGRPITSARHGPSSPRAATPASSSRGISDVWVKLAKCCTPVPGDAILGFVTRGAGVSVHRADCTNASSLKSQPERLVEVEWAPTAQSMFLVNIQVEALDRARLLSDITKVLSDVHVNILAASLQTTRDRVAKSGSPSRWATPSTSATSSRPSARSTASSTPTASPSTAAAGPLLTRAGLQDSSAVRPGHRPGRNSAGGSRCAAECSAGTRPAPGHGGPTRRRRTPRPPASP